MTLSLHVNPTVAGGAHGSSSTYTTNESPLLMVVAVGRPKAKSVRVVGPTAGMVNDCVPLADCVVSQYTPGLFPPEVSSTHTWSPAGIDGCGCVASVHPALNV